MLRCAACGRRLTGDTGYYRHRDPCPEFLAAQPALPLMRGRHATGRGYPMNWYEDTVGDLLGQASLGADVVAKVVAELQQDAAPDPLLLARVRRERSTATLRLERDRDVEAWQETMRRLDAEEAAASSAMQEAIPADQVVDYLRNLPETWRRAAGGRGRRMVAQSLFTGVQALGFREIEFELTRNAVALGLAAALPAEGLELRVSGYGRGERI